MAFEIYRRSQVFFDSLGQPLSFGVVNFTEAGTTTPLDVYSDAAAAVNLGSTETLDAAGRFATAIYANDDCRARFYSADNLVTPVADDDNITDPAGAATSIPALTGNSGKLLTNNGAVLQWIEYLSKLLPDMTGQASKLLTTDGSQPLWKSPADAGVPDYDATNEDTYINFTLGNWRIQGSRATFPVPSGSPPHGASVAVTYDTPFADDPILVVATANKIDIASSGYRAIVVTESTEAILTLVYNTNENSTDPGGDVATTIPVSWLAIGPK
ncbi:hypothetical protein [Noviluteimonas gilva]|uniref:Uncharacterized protein n=1 Tax=Noviluteimonas gilva TaxID=2682097 RepID=A0A7C9HLB4_9GAMM|nr:hypothetical protein [Lysobacter gilvus]MUV13597.1 hypothetical protein [Lysobacter gilvus]